MTRRKMGRRLPALVPLAKQINQEHRLSRSAMVDSLRQLHLGRYRASGAELIMGQARFVGDRTGDFELADGGSAGSERSATPRVPARAEQ